MCYNPRQITGIKKTNEWGNESLGKKERSNDGSWQTEEN